MPLGAETVNIWKKCDAKGMLREPVLLFYHLVGEVTQVVFKTPLSGGSLQIFVFLDLDDAVEASDLKKYIVFHHPCINGILNPIINIHIG